MASTESATHQAETLTAFRLGDWHVDPVSKQISRDGETVRIDPRNMRVLALLASRAGAIVPQREIEEIVWSGSIVTSDSIYQSIAQLRRALGEDKSRRYIDTVPRRGYRLLVPVTPIAASSPPETTTSSAQSADISVFPTQNDARSSARTARIAALVLAGVGVLAAVVWATRVATVEDREHEQSPRVAVSPPATAAVVPPALSSGLSTDHQLPQSYQGASQYRRSIKRLTAVLESVSATSGPDHLSLVPTLVQLANLHPLVSDPLGCEQFARRGLDILVQHGKEASPEGVELNATLAEAFTDTGRFADAEKQLRHTLDLSREVHGPAHYATVSAMDQLALLRIAEGRYAEAVTKRVRPSLRMNACPIASTPATPISSPR